MLMHRSLRCCSLHPLQFSVHGGMETEREHGNPKTFMLLQVACLLCSYVMHYKLQGRLPISQLILNQSVVEKHLLLYSIISFLLSEVL